MPAPDHDEPPNPSDKRDPDQEEYEGEGPWEMRRGPITRVVTWIVLIVFAATVAGMIAVVLFGI